MPTPRAMPTLPRIADYWAAGDNSSVFPDLESRAIGWGEPFCFRCGWLSPLPESVIDGTVEKPEDPWSYASGWLQRAHLAEKSIGGADTADNLVPMCSLCHRQMSSELNRDQAIAWINAWDRAAGNIFWQQATDRTWGAASYRPFVGTGDFLLLRMQVDDFERKARAEAREYARSFAAETPQTARAAQGQAV
jgi:hypothetical protein